MKLAGAALAAILTLAVAAPGDAMAAAVDEVTQSAELTLRPGEVRLQLDISPGAQVAQSVLRQIDADGDAVISDREGKAFGRLVLDQIHLTVDDRAAAWRLETVTAPPHENLRSGAGAIRILAVARRADREGVHTLTFENRYDPAPSQAKANVLVQQGRWRYEVAGETQGADGRRLTVYYESAR
jgi:hypothetical protein